MNDDNLESEYIGSGGNVLAEWPDPKPPTQLDRIEAMLSELIDGKRALEAMAAELQGKGPLAMLSMFK